VVVVVVVIVFVMSIVFQIEGVSKPLVWLKSFETESLLQVLKTWSKTCAQGLFIRPLHLVWEKCGLVHWQQEPVQCTLHMSTAFGVRKMWSCALAMWTSSLHTLDDARLHECNLDLCNGRLWYYK
jgi:hypothetical protein